MSELELHKYITANAIEWHWADNNETPDVLIFPRVYELTWFVLLLSHSHFDDGGIPCNLMDGYVAIWMNDICDYYGINIENVFPKPKQP